MRRTLIALALLAVVLLLADRAAAAYAGNALATELQRVGALRERPTVEVAGFPFLTQALGGRYERIEVAADDVPAGEIALSRFEAVLSGARVPLSDALGRDVDQVPVDLVEARVRLAYDVLSQRSGSRRLTVTPAGDRVRVVGSVEVLGRTLSAAAVSTVTVEGDEVVLTASSFEVGGSVASAALTRALRDRLDLRVPVRGLPYGLVVERVAVQPDGLVVTATARDTVLAAP